MWPTTRSESANANNRSVQVLPSARQLAGCARTAMTRSTLCENTRHAHTEPARQEGYGRRGGTGFSQRSAACIQHSRVSPLRGKRAGCRRGSRCAGVCRPARHRFHGVARLHTYFELHNERRINPRPAIQKSTSQLPTIRSEAISSEGTSTLFRSFRPFRNSQNHQSCDENCEHHKP